MEWRQERVVVETERYRVEGKLTLPREGYRSRLSDHLNRRDHEFFTFVDAHMTRLDGSGAGLDGARADAGEAPHPADRPGGERLRWAARGSSLWRAGAAPRGPRPGGGKN